MTAAQIAELVASARRRSATRADAHLLLSDQIEAMDLDTAAETAIRDTAYRLLFPEHASVMACSDVVEGAMAGEGGSDA